MTVRLKTIIKMSNPVSFYFDLFVDGLQVD